MKLDVKNLISAPFGQKESYNVELFNEKIDEDILAERTIGKVELTRISDEILAQFDVEAKVRMNCDRCLAEFKLKIPLKFSQEYLLDLTGQDDEKLAIGKDFKVDITEPVRQEVMTHLPVQKLCVEGCKGLCAKCGINLNVEKCKCKSATSH